VLRLFDPQAHAPLVDLNGRLRDLAGDAAFQAGRAYLRKGVVKQVTVAGTTAHATVSGSTDYRVSLAFGDRTKAGCTCPAHRRREHCKHVVALCAYLFEQPGDVAEVEAVAAPAQPAGERPRRAKGAGKDKSSEDQAALRAAGMETIDRLLSELADGGAAALGPEKLALLSRAGELVRALKLRRLGNIVLALQRAAAGQGGDAVDANRFVDLLIDLHFTRRATEAHFAGRATMDPRVAEDLVGKTWRDAELEPIAGLELINIARTQVAEGDFQIDTAWLADTGSGAIFAEKRITPASMWRQKAPFGYRHRLVVEDARLYPGTLPRRIKLVTTQQTTLRAADVDCVLAHAPAAVSELRRTLAERLESPFGADEPAVLFRPGGLITCAERVVAIDDQGGFLDLAWPQRWSRDLPTLLPAPGDYALFGMLRLEAGTLQLRCLSVVSGGFAWGRGPIYPDGA
jgi:hypothetical protein